MNHEFENAITKNKNFLLVLEDNFLPKNTQIAKEFQYLIQNFCGIVIKNISEIGQNFEGNFDQKMLYICGNIEKLENDFLILVAKNNNFSVNIIREFSSNNANYLSNTAFKIIPLGKVPVLVHQVGVYFRVFFEENNYFEKIKNEHIFQNLTESNRPSQALRKGIYLTPITKKETENKEEILHFYLLRCSSNLTGATDNFRETDHFIIQELQNALNFVFEQKPPLNHVLAQIYENNKKIDDTQNNKTKETKAKIKAHSDKTKDMPKNGLIAFCTFYEKSNFLHLKPSTTDLYDWGSEKNISALTKLHFKLKNDIQNNTQNEHLEKEFSVILYPNSVFIIPLSTNRLYTHEIRPSMLGVDQIPTRMGYVVRCSKTEAIFVNEQTFIKENDTENDNFVKLVEITEETLADLRKSYLEENKTKNMIEYGKVHFSMNTGDYQKPIF